MVNHLIQKAKKIFVDSLRIRVAGGTGGPGLPQFGGLGGKGGDVCIKGSPDIATLLPIKRQAIEGTFKAPDGHAARRTRLLGKSGGDLIIKSPIGVTIQDADRRVLGEINHPNDKVVVALGGRGGDKFNDSHGFVGQKNTIILDLKLISDAVLVGFPNAGKSSLLAAISGARPKIANYPFTTLKPNLGVVKFHDERRITVADLPGLVEGAHENIGLGHDFLKHMIRTRLLIFMIDINGVDLGPEYKIRTPLETVTILNREIELYDDTILDRPAILAVSKMDTLDDSMQKFIEFEKALEQLQKDTRSSLSLEEDLRPSRVIHFDDVLPISSKSGLNIDKLKVSIRNVIDKHAEEAKAREDQFSTYAELQPLENNRILR